MKPLRLTPLLLLAFGCAQPEANPAPANASASLSAGEKIEKIQKDPEIPEGLKQIQTEQLQKERIGDR